MLDEKKAINKEALSNLSLKNIKKNNSSTASYFYNIESIFDKNDIITLNNKKLELFLNGVKLDITHDNGVVKVYDSNKKFIGLAIIENNILKRDVII